MNRLAKALLLVCLLAQAAQAQTSLRILNVTEKPAPEKKDSVCARDQAVCHADIESTLVIEPDAAAIPKLEGRSILAEETLASRRSGLLSALDALRESLVLSREIIELVRQGLDEPESLQRGQELSARFNAREIDLIQALQRYVRDNAAEFGLSADPSQKEVRNALRDAFPVRSGKTDEWIANELRKIDRLEAERAEALKAQSELLVRLGAFRIRPGAEPVALHLPGYDDIEAGELTKFQRITFEVTEEQKQKLAEEIKFNADVIAKIQALRTEAEKSGGALKALVDEAEALADSLQTNLDGIQEDLEAQLGDIAPGLADLRASIEGLQTSVKAMKAEIESLKTALDDVTDGVAADRPDLVLLNILGKLQPLQDGGPFKEVLAQAAKVRESVERVRTQLPAASAAVQTALKETLQEALTSAAQDAGPLAQLAGLLRIPGADKMKQTAENLGAILAVKMGDPQRFDVAGDKIVPTELEILRSGPERGDSIELVLEIRRRPTSGVEGEQGALVHEERKSISIDVYGWSSGLASGIGMIKAEKTDLANFEPSAIAVWRLGYRPRPGDGIGWYSLRPGIGIHVSTLDFDPDASVEFGAGVSLHLFEDLLQVGYGWNLNVEGDDRPYWYLGIGLFNLLRGD